MRVERKGTQLGLLGMSASILCAIHCISLPFIVSAGALGLTQLIQNPIIEFSLIAISIIIGYSVIKRGYASHGKKHILVLFACSAVFLFLFGILLHSHDSFIGSFGGIGIAISFFLNWRAAR